MFTRVLVAAVTLGAAGCQSEQVARNPPPGGGTGVVGTPSAAGAGGGESGTGGGAGGAGDGGSATSNGSQASGGTSSSGSGDGGAPPVCSTDGGCAGDQESTCGAEVCATIFHECAQNTPSAPLSACEAYATDFRTGIWARLVDCMSAYDEATECGPQGGDVVEACVDEALADICENPTVSSACEAIEAECEDAGETFAVEDCKADLMSASDSAIAEYEACIAEVGIPCEGAHAECFSAGG